MWRRRSAGDIPKTSGAKLERNKNIRHLRDLGNISTVDEYYKGYNERKI